MANTFWSSEEVSLLLEMVGDYPREMVFNEYRRQAKMKGWPERTPKAIQIKVTKLGLTFKCYGEYLGITEVAQLLGIGRDRVDHWVSRYSNELKVIKFGKSKRVVHRKNWKAWARVPSHQRHMGGIPVYRLIRLLEDQKLAEAIAKAHPRSPGSKVAVRCVETGFRYPSMMAAARANYVTHAAIWHGVTEGYPVAGRRYEVVS